MFKLFQRKNKSKSGNEADPRLAPERGRRAVGGGFESYLRDIWDASTKSRRMGQTLLKRALRVGEAERVRDEQIKRHARSIRLKALSQSEGFKDLVEVMQAIESDAYGGLAMPGVRDANQSLEYFVGYQNGNLACISRLRIAVNGAVEYLESLKREEVESIYESNTR